MQQGDPLLSVQGVSLARGSRDVLREVSFRISSGERLMLLGRSGSGKTTLLRALAGLLEFDRGRIEWLAEEQSERDSGTRVGFVRQHPDVQLLASTVAEEIRFGLAMGGGSQDHVQAVLEEALTLFDLESCRESNPTTLSAGTQQRLALAAAWALRPALWLLDEPTAYLDPSATTMFRELLSRLPDDATVIWATSDPDEYTLADRSLLLDDGRLVCDGPPAEVLQSGRFTVTGLTPPRISLLQALRTAELRVPPTPASNLPESEGSVSTAVPSARSSDSFVLHARDLVVWRRDLLTPATNVLRGVSLELSPGECVALVGPSGAGKTTLLETLAGLIDPESGRITVSEETVEGSSRRRAVGLTFQFPERGFFAETVLEEVCYGPRNLGLDRREAVAAARHALERMALDPDVYSARSPFELSGGEARRVAIASMVAMQPRILLLDEPTAGLDTIDADRLGALLDRERAEGRTIVVAGHDIDWLADHCDRWIVLEAGLVRHDGDPRELWTGEPPWICVPPATVRVWRERGWDIRTMPGLNLHHVLGERSIDG